MRHIFIVNPAAGKKDVSAYITEEINSVCAAHDIEPLVFISEYAGYEQEMTEKICDLFPEDELRFYAVGGSGTLANIVTGIRDYSTTEVACYPAGLTNDLLKSYGGSAELFRSIEALMDGKVDLLDMIDINGYRSLDFVSFGLGNTCFNDWLIFKMISAVRSYFNYEIGVAYDILRNKCANYHIEIDGRDYSGEYGLVICFNGMCMGGRVMPLKDPRPNDGVMNILLAEKIPRMEQLVMLSDFIKGKLEGYGDVLEIVKGKKVTVYREDKQPIVYNCDGGCIKAANAEIKLTKDKLRFVVPKEARVLMPTFVDEQKLESSRRKKQR